MREIVDYLMDNYYSKYVGPRTDIVPSHKMLEEGLIKYADKVVIVKDDRIRGVAIFVTLTDETMDLLESFDITQMDVLRSLLQEHGDNIHFVMLCADGRRTIMQGLDYVKNKHHPKTISWWNPDLTKLHIRRF